MLYGERKITTKGQISESWVSCQNQREWDLARNPVMILSLHFCGGKKNMKTTSGKKLKTKNSMVRERYLVSPLVVNTIEGKPHDKICTALCLESLTKSNTHMPQENRWNYSYYSHTTPKITESIRRGFEQSIKKGEGVTPGASGTLSGWRSWRTWYQRWIPTGMGGVGAALSWRREKNLMAVVVVQNRGQLVRKSAGWVVKKAVCGQESGCVAWRDVPINRVLWSEI